MLQAVATMMFLSLGVAVAAGMSAMMRANWLAVRTALGLAGPRPVPPTRYRVLPSQSLRIMTPRETERCRTVA